MQFKYNINRVRTGRVGTHLMLVIAATLATHDNYAAQPDSAADVGQSQTIIEIGSRRELFVDHYLVESTSGDIHHLYHQPVARNVSLITDMPWEGNYGAYATVFKDGDTYRFYYSCVGIDLEAMSPGDTFGDGYWRNPYMCYAESDDGIEWKRKNLGLYEVDGSKDNNIVWDGDLGADIETWPVFTPFRDERPAVSPDARYKAIARSTRNGIYALKSPDGFRWTLMQPDPVLTSPSDGRFDANNFGFWDREISKYRIYVRDLRAADGASAIFVENGNFWRDIRTATSDDFLTWTPRPPQWLDHGGARDEHLYGFPIVPYYRASNIYVGFPVRYVYRPGDSAAVQGLPEPDFRRKLMSFRERIGSALTESLLMISRDGVKFTRKSEAFIRPGPQKQGNWIYGDNFAAWGMVPTPAGRPGAPDEISMYVSENVLRGKGVSWRRFSLRVDGFASFRAAMTGGEILTKPLTFHGSQLLLNVSTSAAGSVRVEIQDANGQPIDGFSLKDSKVIVADELDRLVEWNSDHDVSTLSGRPIRIRFVLEDADIYSFQFRTEK